MSKIKESLKWVYTMIMSKPARRKEWVKLIIEGIRSYRGENAQDKKGAVWLSDVIQDDSKWEVIGFSVHEAYVRLDGSEDETNCMFIHPWGTPPLLLKHKTLPIIMTVGPGIRWNDTVLNELKGNEALEYIKNLVGFSG